MRNVCNEDTMAYQHDSAIFPTAEFRFCNDEGSPSIC